MRGKRRTQEEWTKIIEDHPKSGKSVADYCKEVGISEKTFYTHRGAMKRGIQKVMVEPKNIKATINGIEVETDCVTLRKLLGIPQ